MRTRVSTLFLTLLLLGGAAVGVGIPAATADAATFQVDTEVPPGNPVIGSERPGDTEPASETNYALWGLVACCLIAAGLLLVNIERWEARRIKHAEAS